MVGEVELLCFMHVCSSCYGAVGARFRCAARYMISPASITPVVVMSASLLVSLATSESIGAIGLPVERAKFKGMHAKAGSEEASP